MRACSDQTFKTRAHSVIPHPRPVDSTTVLFIYYFRLQVENRVPALESWPLSANATLQSGPADETRWRTESTERSWRRRITDEVPFPSIDRQLGRYRWNCSMATPHRIKRRGDGDHKCKQPIV